MLQVIWHVLTNHSVLFQSALATLLCNFVMKLCRVFFRLYTFIYFQTRFCFKVTRKATFEYQGCSSRIFYFGFYGFIENWKFLSHFTGLTWLVWPNLEKYRHFGNFLRVDWFFGIIVTPLLAIFCYCVNILCWKMAKYWNNKSGNLVTLQLELLDL